MNVSLKALETCHTELSTAYSNGVVEGYSKQFLASSIIEKYNNQNSTITLI